MLGARATQEESITWRPEKYKLDTKELKEKQEIPVL